ncbi:uncharacterized protein LOC121369462 [Gigantopelta aegis]|uniref:uncharacterized protein LOC121369462 n=1 Tax=Gigantopelta aegis TaxID=1735272 RepID=UPI001B88BC07|nr:uncharacterized protein LOC121369462 [Gigantopelta aegis]
MLRTISLVLLAFGCILPSSMANQCWNGNIVRDCLIYGKQTTTCYEFMLRELYDDDRFKKSMLEITDSWVNVCVPCTEAILQISGTRVECPVDGDFEQDEKLEIYNVLVFVYIIKSSHADATISFDVIRHGKPDITSVRIKGPSNGVHPVGPFYVEPPLSRLLLKWIRCVDDMGHDCDVKFAKRRPFSFVHYIHKKSLE